MANILHSSLSPSEAHEPKGIAGAPVDTCYVADGAGSGAWQILNPYGGIIYNDLAGSGTTFSTPTAYTLMNPVTAATNTRLFSTNNLGRLTFNGNSDRHVHAVFDSSFKHSTGSGQDVFFQVYKNGSALGSFEVGATADSANFIRISAHFDDMASGGDYYEVYLKTATGSVIVHQFYMFIMGMPG